jgi:hypothetical protein
MAHQYLTAEGTFRLQLATPAEDEWRGGVAAVIVDEQGERIANVQIYCHPDFRDYETCRALSADAMLEQTAERLQVSGHDHIVLAESCEASVGLLLNPPK